MLPQPPDLDPRSFRTERHAEKTAINKLNTQLQLLWLLNHRAPAGYVFCDCKISVFCQTYKGSDFDWKRSSVLNIHWGSLRPPFCHHFFGRESSATTSNHIWSNISKAESPIFSIFLLKLYIQIEDRFIDAQIWKRSWSMQNLSVQRPALKKLVVTSASIHFHDYSIPTSG